MIECKLGGDLAFDVDMLTCPGSSRFALVHHQLSGLKWAVLLCLKDVPLKSLSVPVQHAIHQHALSAC